MRMLKCLLLDQSNHFLITRTKALILEFALDLNIKSRAS